MRFRTRATLFGALSAGVLFCGFAVLAIRTSGETDRRLNEAHLTFVLTTLNHAVEAGLRLDMPLGELQQLNDFFARTIADEPDILAVEVFDSNGISSFGTDRGADGEPVSPQWLAAVRESAGHAVWRSSDGDELVLGTPIESDFGSVLGQTALIIDRSALDQAESTGTPVMHLLPALLAVILAGGLAGYGTATVVQRRVDRLTAQVAAGNVPAPAGAPPLTQALNAAMLRLNATRATIRTINDELQAIDAEL